MGMNRPHAIAISLCLLAGCGVDLNDFRPPTFHNDGNCESDDSNCTVVLDWTGGDSPIWSGDGDLPPIDLSEFELAWPYGAWTLADVDGFTEAVRAEVESVLAGSGLRMIVEEGEQRSDTSVVHFSQVVDPVHHNSLGRGHFDMCNLSDRDYSIVYAARFLEERRLDVDDWVRTFANVAAHEVAHNLGFDHVELEDVPAGSGFTELMLAEQTSFQRVREQRIIVEQDTCDIFAAAKVVAEPDRDGRPTRRLEKQ